MIEPLCEFSLESSHQTAICYCISTKGHAGQFCQSPRLILPTLYYKPRDVTVGYAILENVFWENKIEKLNTLLEVLRGHS